jgi:hypothetical protein
VAIFALVVVGLVACAEEPAVPPEPTPAPTASAPTAESVAPQSYWDIECDDILGAEDIEAIGLAVAPVDRVVPGRPGILPEDYVIQTVGGLACSWSDGVGVGTAAESYIRFEAIPKAQEQWAHPWHVPQGPDCFDVTCVAEVLTVDGSWITLTVHGAAAEPTAFDPTVEGVVAELDGAERTELAGVPEQHLAEDCEDLAAMQSIRAAFDTSATLEYGTAGGGWSLFSAAQTLAGLPAIPSCFIQSQGNRAAFGQITLLQEAAWAFDKEGVSAGERVTLAGADDDAGYRTCGSDFDGCTVDFMVDDTWVRVAVFVPEPLVPGESIDPGSSSPPEAAVNIAEIIVA